MPAAKRTHEPRETADAVPLDCIPTEIYTDVVKAKIVRDGSVMRKIRVAKKVHEIDFCAAEVIQSRVETGEGGWEVNALFRVVVGYDSAGGDHVVRTIAFYKTRIPFPLTTSSSSSARAPRPVSHRKLEARVRIDGLQCNAAVGADEHTIIAELSFEIVLLLMRDEVITVCRLRPLETE